MFRHRLGDEATTNKAYCSNSTLPIRKLSTFERPIVSAGGAIQVHRAPVVANDDDKGISKHVAVSLQRGDDAADGVVRLSDHREIGAPLRPVHMCKLVIPAARHL